MTRLSDGRANALLSMAPPGLRLRVVSGDTHERALRLVQGTCAHGEGRQLLLRPHWSRCLFFLEINVRILHKGSVTFMLRQPRAGPFR